MGDCPPILSQIIGFVKPPIARVLSPGVFLWFYKDTERSYPEPGYDLAVLPNTMAEINDCSAAALCVRAVYLPDTA